MEDQIQDGKKAYLELWKNVVYKMETAMTDFVGDWVSKDVTMRHITTYIHIFISLKT
jgi:hypothetical protein